MPDRTLLVVRDTHMRTYLHGCCVLSSVLWGVDGPVNTEDGLARERFKCDSMLRGRDRSSQSLRVTAPVVHTIVVSRHLVIG